MFKSIKQGRVYRIPTFELALIREKSYPADRKKISNPDDAYRIARLELDDAPNEKFLVIMLTTKNSVIGTSIVSTGVLNASLVSPREIFQRAILSNAASLICVHNHPSGDPTASSEDITLTKKLAEAGNLLNIPILDHVIIGDGRYISLKEKGVI